MVEARRAAFKAGLAPSEFWASTPNETFEFCEHAIGAQYKHALFAAWHTALFTRQKKLPELNKVMDVKRTVKKQDPDVLKQKVLALHAAFGGR